MELVLIVLVVLVLVGAAAGVAATARRRSRTVELEPPPPGREVARPGPRPAGSGPARRDTGGTEAPHPEAPVEPAPEEAVESPPAVVADQPPEPDTTLTVAPDVAAPDPDARPPEPVSPPRFRDRLSKARTLLAGYLGSVLSRSAVDEETFEDLEEALIRADVGVGLTTELLDGLRARVKEDGISDPDALVEALKADLKARLSEGDRSLRLEPGTQNVWLFVGVNGVGKTTTIGKLGRRAVGDGRRVVMAAGDTFRAAAAEQLELWAQRVGADLVRGAEGADPGSVVFDAVERAAARDAELVLADTAGRLHTKVNLMEELKKVRRVADRPPGKVSEVLLVLDATTGQNGLVQAKQFTEAVQVTGIVLTKLDGTAKGGIALAIHEQLSLPIKLVGLGEGADDLVDFDPDEFVEALFS